MNSKSRLTFRPQHLASGPDKIIPTELQAIVQWILWRVGPAKPDGGFTKLPIGKDGTGRQWQRPQQWMDFEAATKKAQCGPCAGIGLVLPAVTPNGLHLVALDFDDVNLASEMHNPRLDEIRQIHKAFGEPYVEESPSGSGLRMFVTSKVPIQQTSAPNSLGGKDEIFGQSAGRWVTVTGKVLGGSGIPDVTEAILAFQARIAQRTTKGVTSQRTIKQSSATKQTPKNCQVDEATKVLSKGWTESPRESWRPIGLNNEVSN
jgi:primase-polymerase (primpol)-like protein